MHGEVESAKRKDSYLRCKKCATEAVQRRQRELQLVLKVDRGGKCELCTYSKCLQALEWHHVDPTQKSFGIASGGYGKSLKTLRLEVKKCILLCANCHREVEYGITDLVL